MYIFFEWPNVGSRPRGVVDVGCKANNRIWRVDNCQQIAISGAIQSSLAGRRGKILRAQ